MNGNAVSNDKLPLPKLPNWEPVEKAVEPPPLRQERCQVTEDTLVRVKYGADGCGVVFGWLSRPNPRWPAEGNDAKQRLAVLEFVAAEMEQALPIIRAMIQQMKEAADE